MELETSQSFNRYVLPKQPIAVTAQQVTGISLSCNEMTVNGHIVEPSSVTTALNDFCTWLEKFNNVILVAHNGRRFDFPVIISAINNVQLQERFFKCVSGCTDSLSVFRKQYPGRSSYKQIDLVHDILGATYGAHDATEDVRALGHLLKHSASHQTVLPFSFSPEAVYKNQIYNREKSKNFPSLSVLVSSGICKLNIAENIAGSGLNLEHLRTIFSREGEDGLTNIFISKNSDGQPRVTNTKRVLESVIPKLVELFSKNS
ncbi:uncharacterized protein LOC123537131 [Mercenaria mercenaria]|uniref:uncharacterized protein LOC123537131 n=1 Tax=Mercenaria mercenaria TaxID=6596 RepID=UPI00234F3914|nr:uncharacterized protein LOC123537131 [Mercenaria mercenaria]